MNFNIVVADLGGAEGGVFAVWLKAVGDLVLAGEAVAEVMTDKVNVEIVAPAAGTIESVAVGDEDHVTLDQVIGTIRGAV